MNAVFNRAVRKPRCAGAVAGSECQDPFFVLLSHQERRERLRNRCGGVLWGVGTSTGGREPNPLFFERLCELNGDYQMGDEESVLWERLKSTWHVGQVVSGIVKIHRAFGVFVDLDIPFQGLIEIIQFKDEGRMTPKDFPEIGSPIHAVITGFGDSNHQIHLTVKPSALRNVDAQDAKW